MHRTHTARTRAHTPELKLNRSSRIPARIKRKLLSNDRYAKMCQNLMPLYIDMPAHSHKVHKLRMHVNSLRCASTSAIAPL